MGLQHTQVIVQYSQLMVGITKKSTKTEINTHIYIYHQYYLQQLHWAIFTGKKQYSMVIIGNVISGPEWENSEIIVPLPFF
jgi:hypothetical protein